MSGESRLLRSLQLQGQICAGMGSPMYGDVLDRVAADVHGGGVFAAILSGHENDSGRLAVPLRLLGGLHRLALDGSPPRLRSWYPSTGGQWDAEAAWPDITLAASDHADRLRATLDQPPQTNEVGRAPALGGGAALPPPPIHFPCTAFRDRVQRRAQPARGLFPLSPSGRPMGSDRLTGDDRRRVARPNTSRRGARDSRAVW